MSSVGHFPVQFAGLEECPNPFREPLRRALSPSEAVLEIIYSLAFVTGRLCLPASVFCVTNRQWIMVHESKSGDVRLDNAVFVDTLLIELTAILRISVAQSDPLRACDPRSEIGARSDP